jgi:RNA-directed DNA polymerase
VSENDGKRTPGVDGEVWSTPEAKWQAIQRLGSCGLRPQPLRRVYIPKRGSQTKMRPLGIPTMIIRAQQALHLQGLEPVAETRADPHSYGFRRSRGTHRRARGMPAVAVACCFCPIRRARSRPSVP